MTPDCLMKLYVGDLELMARYATFCFRETDKTWWPKENFVKPPSKQRRGYWVALKNKYETFWPYIYPPFKSFPAVVRFAEQLLKEKA